jgi:hypothetical protein
MVFSSSLYRGRGPPKTDMKEGNESGKDGGLVCTGIVRGGIGRDVPSSRDYCIRIALAACANGLKGQSEMSCKGEAREMEDGRGNRDIPRVG